jgi:DNA repair protein RecO (recombination protein O)
MDEWRDTGIIVAVKPHGEHGGVVSLLTEQNGRHAGFAHGVQSTKKRGDFELGTVVDAEWAARLSDNLGTYKLQAEKSYAVHAMDDPKKLMALQSLCALAHLTLPEREPCPGVYEASLAFLDSLPTEIWAPAYIYWELGLLRSLGFGVDLSQCAASGTTEDLIYVSPKTARAVCRAEGQIYKERLLPLPGFLMGTGEFDDQALADGLMLTGYFLQHRVFGMTSNLSLPEIRHRLYQSFLG